MNVLNELRLYLGTNSLSVGDINIISMPREQTVIHTRTAMDINIEHMNEFGLVEDAEWIAIIYEIDRWFALNRPGVIYRLVLGLSSMFHQDQRFSTSYSAENDHTDRLMEIIEEFRSKYEDGYIQAFNMISIEVVGDVEYVFEYSPFPQCLLAWKNKYIFNPKEKCLLKCFYAFRIYKYRPNLLIDSIKFNASFRDWLKGKYVQYANGLFDTNLIDAMCNHFSIDLYIWHYGTNNIYFKNTKERKETMILWYKNCHLYLILPRQSLVKSFTKAGMFDLLLPKYKFVQEIKKKDLTLVTQGLEDKDLMEEFDSPHKKIIKVNKQKEIDNKIMVIDIEAYRQNIKDTKLQEFIPYALGVSWYNERVLRFHHFWGKNCVKDFVNWLVSYMGIFEGYCCYAHNGADFDFHLLFKYGILNHPSIKVLEKSPKMINQGGSLLTFGIEINGKKIIFRDSYRILMSSLEKLGKELDVIHKKLTGTVDHNLIKADNFNSYKTDILKYLEHDCYCLLEVLEAFNKDCYNILKININEIVSASSLAKKNFYNKYYNFKDFPIFTLPYSWENMIRRSYYGGRTEAFFIGEKKDPVYMYDVTSLYPFAGCNYLPYGKPEIVNESQVFDENGSIKNNFFGWVECWVSGPFSNKASTWDYRFHCMYYKNKLVFPTIKEKQRLVLFSEDIYFAQTKNLGYKYEFIQGIKYKRKERLLKDLFVETFQQKQKAKEEGKPALEYIWKLILNCTYGFWGLKTRKLDSVSHLDIRKKEECDHKFKLLLKTGNLKDWNRIGDYLFIRHCLDIESKDTCVAIAAAITSYSRQILFNIMIDIQAKGYYVYYVDTDSVLTNCCIENYKDLMDQWNPSGTAKNLGELKNEVSEALKKVKVHPDHQEIWDEYMSEPEFHCFDKIAIAGAKMYCLEKKLSEMVNVKKPDGTPLDDIIKHACKGIKKKENITFADQKIEFGIDMFGLLVKGYVLEQAQTQFASGNQYILLDNFNSGVYYKHVDKQIKSIYTKGEVDIEGNVTPLTIQDMYYTVDDKHKYKFEWLKTPLVPVSSARIDNVLNKKRKK